MTVPDVAWPLDAGKRLRVESVVRAVAARCDVDLAVLFADADPALRPAPPDVALHRWHVQPPVPRPLPVVAVRAVLGRVPWQVAAQPWRQVAEELRSWPGPYDLVWFGALEHAARLAGAVPARRVVVDCDDVETDKWRTFLSGEGGRSASLRDQLQRRVELPLWGRLQRLALRRADAVLVCSELDRERLLLGRTGRARVEVVPNTYAGPARPPERRPSGPFTMVLIANFGTDQNVDAAAYAVREVLPLLRAAVPGARLRLVGRRTDRVEHLGGADGLDLVGPVDDVTAELAAAHAVLVTMRFGGGTRLKILEAMAYGVPVVSTTIGAEGLGVVHGEHVLLADTAPGLAAAAAQLAGDPALGQRLATRAHELYDSTYTPRTTHAAVARLLDELLAAPAAQQELRT